METLQNFYLVANSEKDPSGQLTETVRNIIEENGGSCLGCFFKGRNTDDQYEKVDSSLIPKETDLIISLGGDGSFLHTAKDLIDLHIPVMGVNMGTLGYLTEMDLSGFQNEFHHIISGDCHVEERMLLQGSIIRNGQTLMQDIAINDIVLNRVGSMNIISFDVLVNDRFLNSYSADGYIICSPTGSTGYNLSAGGPVAHPVSEIIITTPICEHTLNSRSVVFSADAQIDVIVRDKNRDDKQVQAISFDGDRHILLEDRDIVRVTKSEKKLRNLRLDKLSFVEHLGRKMR